LCETERPVSRVTRSSYWPEIVTLVESRDGNRTLILKFGSVKPNVRVRFGSTIITVRVRFGSVRLDSKCGFRFDFMKLGDSKTK
jgi:hypothetical protein